MNDLHEPNARMNLIVEPLATYVIEHVTGFLVGACIGALGTLGAFCAKKHNEKEADKK